MAGRRFRITWALLAFASVVASRDAAVLLAQEIPPVVFVERGSRFVGNQLAGGFVPGQLRVRESNGSLRTIALPENFGSGDSIVAVADPDVSWDLERIAFAGYLVREGAWRIFSVRLDESDLRQVTRSDRELDLARFGESATALERYDDLDPCWLPDGRICFVSTRYPAFAPDRRVRGTNLFVVNADSTDLHRITTERFGADTPSIDPETGRIVYSRWWTSGVNLAGAALPPPRPGYYEPVPVVFAAEVEIEESATVSTTALGADAERIGGVNTWTLATIRPDGTDLAMFGGPARDRVRSVAYRPSFTRSGDALAVFLRETPNPGQPLVSGLRLFERGAMPSLSLGGPQVLRAPSEELDFAYTSAVEIPGDELLVVGRPFGSREEVDLWIQSRSRTGWTRILPESDGRVRTDAVVVSARPLPPILADTISHRSAGLPPRSVDEAFETGGRFTFLCENIFANAPLEQIGIGVAPSARAAQTIEFWMNPPGPTQDRGEVPTRIASLAVPPSGRVEIELPADVPLFEVLRLDGGRVPVARDLNLYHVQAHNWGVAGTTSRCVGCHVGHSMIDLPAELAEPAPFFSNLAPGADLVASSGASTSLVSSTVDRSVTPDSVWMASAGVNAQVELRWFAPIRAREVLLHAAAGETFTTLASVTIRTRHGELLDDGGVGEGTLAVSAVDDVVRVSLDEEQSLDRLEIDLVLRDDARAEGESIRLAEIEVIAVPVDGVTDGESRFRRGDADCDGTITLTDGVRTLRALFDGVSLCCEVAADVDGDDRVLLTDAVRSFQYLFGAGPQPAEPFTSCGSSSPESLSCAFSTCR